MIEHGLFRWGASRSEVKQSIIADYKRDQKRLSWTDLLTGLALLALVKDLDLTQKIGAFGLVTTALAGIRLFIDQSNRNWFLHMLDFERAKECEASEDL